MNGKTGSWVDYLFSAPAVAFTLAMAPAPVAAAAIGGYYVKGGTIGGAVSQTSGALSSVSAGAGEFLTELANSALMKILAVVLLVWIAWKYGRPLLEKVA